LKIKICGITNFEDAVLSIKYGADFLGFIFAESPRKIEIKTCAEIIRTIKKDMILTVGVFMNQPIEYIEDVDIRCGFDLIQLHGGENVKEYKEKLNKPVIKRVTEIEKLECCMDADYLLFDKTKLNGEILEILSLKDYDIKKPYFLAGGLNCENAETLLEGNNAFGADVSSGIEKFPGKKDEMKLRRFIDIIRHLK